MTHFRRIAKITRALGVTFRSRLECKVACVFEALEIQWRYECRLFKVSKKTHYLPDFFCSYRGDRFWFEVKPKRPKKSEVAKAHGVVRQSPYPILLSTNDPFFDPIFECNTYWSDNGHKVFSDQGRFIDYLGMRYSEFNIAVANARMLYHSLDLP